MTKYLRKISTPSKVSSTQIIDSLNSTSKTDALSADAGRELNEKIDVLENYSTEEKIIGKWIDGKPIYRKVVNVGSGSGNFTHPHGISNLDIIVNIYGSFLQGGTHREPLPKTTFASASPGWSAHIDDFTDTTFSLHFGTGIAATKICVVIEYTKNN